MGDMIGNAFVAFAVYVVMGFVVAPLIKLFLQDGTAGQVNVTQGAAILLGVVFLMVDTGLPPMADGHAWLGFVTDGIITGLAAIGVHAKIGSPTPAIVSLANRRKRQDTPPAVSPTTVDTATKGTLDGA